MKTKILLLIFCCISFSVFSQGPTLTMLNSGPQPGDVFAKYQADTTNVGFGASGENIIWDYTNLVLDNYLIEEEFRFYSPLSSPHVQNANEYYFTQGPNYNPIQNFVNVTETEYSLAGFSTYVVIYLEPSSTTFYNDPLVFFTYPFHYSDSFTDQVSGVCPQYFYNFATFRQGTSSTTADGYGTLKLPQGTFENVLRIKMVQNFRDSTIYTNNDSSSVYENKEEIYLWYDGIQKAPLLKIQKSSHFYNDTTTYHKVVYVTDRQTGINDPFGAGTSFNVFPNPASEKTNLSFTFSRKTEAGFTILTLAGKEMVQMPVEIYEPGSYTRSFNVSSLPCGMYLVRCTTPSGIVCRKMCVNR